MRLLAAALMLTLAGPAAAQQPAPDTALMRVISALQAQRNAAADQAAGEKARADGLQSQVDDLNKKLAAATAPNPAGTDQATAPPAPK